MFTARQTIKHISVRV